MARTSYRCATSTVHPANRLAFITYWKCHGVLALCGTRVLLRLRSETFQGVAFLMP